MTRPPPTSRSTSTTEPQTRLAALTTGEVHIAEPPYDEVPAIKESGEFDIIVADNTGQDVFWEFTVHRPPFNDIRARQAVAYATDPQLAIEIIYGDLTQREWCPVARGVFGNDQEFCKQFGYEYDPEKAKALLAELGYGPDKPLETTMFVWTGGDVHLYSNHLEQARTQLEREPRGLPQLILKDRGQSLFDYEPDDFAFEAYDPHPHISAPVAV